MRISSSSWIFCFFIFLDVHHPDPQKPKSLQELFSLHLSYTRIHFMKEICQDPFLDIFIPFAPFYHTLPLPHIIIVNKISSIISSLCAIFLHFPSILSFFLRSIPTTFSLLSLLFFNRLAYHCLEKPILKH